MNIDAAGTERGDRMVNIGKGVVALLHVKDLRVVEALVAVGDVPVVDLKKMKS